MDALTFTAVIVGSALAAILIARGLQLVWQGDTRWVREQVCLALRDAPDPRNSWEITLDIRQRTRREVPYGTLFHALALLRADGIVERLERVTYRPDGRHTRWVYRLIAARWPTAGRQP